MEQPVVSIEAYVWGSTPSRYGIFIDAQTGICIAHMREGVLHKGENINWLAGKAYRLAGRDAANALSKGQTIWCHIGNLMSDGTFVYTLEL